MKKILLSIVFTLLTVLLSAQNKKVAVWETKCDDNSITKFQSVMVRGGMEAAVANAPGYTGFDRASFDAIIKEHNFQRSGAVNDSDIKRLGEMAGVQYIIVPEAMASENDFYIIVKMLDVESGEFGAAYEELCTTSATDIKNACARLGSQLFNIPYHGSSGNNNSYSSSNNSGNGNVSIIGQILSKVLTNVSAVLEGGGSHIGDTDNSGIVLQYDAVGNLYCGGYGYDANTTTIGMYVAANGYEIPNCPGSWAFVGKYKNGSKEGDGLVYDREGNLIYSGTFVNDSPIETYPDAYARSVAAFNAYDMGNGDYYIGETIEGVLDGCGIYVWSDGDAWFGFWKDGVQNGPGIMMYYNGNYTIGTWENGQKESDNINTSSSSSSSNSGTSLADRPWETLLNKAMTNAPIKWDNGDSRIGGKDNIIVYLWKSSGAFYAGECRDNYANGLGMFVVNSELGLRYCPEGCVYVGTVKNWNMDGDYGLVFNKQGKLIYKGKFKDDKPVDDYPSSDFIQHTYSNYTFEVEATENGHIYVGQKINGIRDGVGMYLWPDGSCWVGNWKNGTRNGFGTEMYYDGSWLHGKWEDGKLVKTSTTSN